MLGPAVLLLLSSALASAQVAENWPNWIIPLSSAEPNRALGNQKSGHIALQPRSDGGVNIIGTEIVFDFVPTSTGASYCTVDFTLASTGLFTLTGGPARFQIYNVFGGFINETDTYNSHPQHADISMGTVTVKNGVASVASVPVRCTEQKVQLILLPSPGAPYFDFTWFELNDPAHGLYNGITFKQWK